MAAPGKDGWAVNFIYEQDLRSQYMNQLFLEMLQPGVYNPQLYLKPDTMNGNTNISLITGVGTTIIFRNGTSSDNMSPWLIKCTATKPLVIDTTGLRVVSNTSDVTSGTEIKDIINAYATESSVKDRLAYYIFAFMRYHPQKKDKNAYATEPRACAYYRTLNESGEVTFKKVGESIPWAPKEIKSDISYFEEISWVLLGKVNWTLKGKTPADPISGDVPYHKAMEFIGLGAPSYRHGLYMSKTQLPTLLPYNLFNNGASSGTTGTPRTRFQGFKPALKNAYYSGKFLSCNNEYLDNINGDNPITIESSNPDMYKPKAKDECTWVAPLVTKDDNSLTTWVDLVYGAVKRYALDKESTYSTTSEKLTVFCLSVPETSLTSTSLNRAKYENYQEDEVKLLNETLSDYKQNYEAIPLDMNVTAMERKLSFLTEDHPNIISWALNTAIKNNLISSNTTGTDIIPLALVFRQSDDDQEITSDDIIPILHNIAGSDAIIELTACRPEFSTVNIM